MLKLPMKLLSQSLISWNSILKEHTVLEMARQRVFIMGGVVSLAFLAVTVRLVDVMLLTSNQGRLPKVDESGFSVARGNITDRSGEVLATNIITASVYANPKVIIDPEDAAKKLISVLPEQKYDDLLKRLKSGKGFVWIDRHVPPKVQQAVNHLGIPGVYLYRDQRRVYTHGSLASHLIGMCGIDGNGLAGVEKFFDAEIRQRDANIQLALDLRIQHIVREELSSSVQEFSANGGNAIVMHIKTGEIVSMVSLPDFDPNAPSTQISNALFNRNTLGAYEPGSTFKILNVAIALESGKATLQSVYDASRPVQIGRFQVTDFKGKNRPLTLQEAFVYSSNIASIKIAQQFGSKTQRAFLKQFGAFDKVSLEIPEVGSPLVPKNWAEVTTMTVSYGYGISVTPLQLAAMISTIINNGHRVVPTLIKRQDPNYDSTQNEQVISVKTSATVRELMRMVVTDGTAKTADIPGFDVIGKTGTAYQSTGRGGYGGDNKTRTTTFIGAFPKDKPEYLLIVMLDNPHPTKSTHGYATAGWNAAPTAGKIINRIGPMLVTPTEKFEPNTQVNKLINTNHIQQISINDDADH